MRPFLQAFAACFLLTAAGCSQGVEETKVETEVVQAIQDYVAERRSPKVERPPLTRAALDETVVGAFIEVTIENTGVTAYLFTELQRRDGLPGEITVWRSEDDVTLAMRNGLLTATRGLPGSLLSARVPAADGVMGPARGGGRRYVLRGLDEGSQAIEMACSLEDLGRTTVEIVELVHKVQHLKEHCEGGGGVVTNEYWVDSTGARVWQSRQWAGPKIGYLSIRQLTL